MPVRSRRPFRAPPASDHYSIDPPLDDDDMPGPCVDANAWQPEPFPQDVTEAQLDEADAETHPLPAECPLCQCLDDPLNCDPNSIAASILEYESVNFGRVTDYVLFSQMSEAYNERVWKPAFDRASHNPHLNLTVPVQWTRLIVKRHFESCKHLTTRRRMARLLRQVAFCCCCNTVLTHHRLSSSWICPTKVCVSTTLLQTRLNVTMLRLKYGFHTQRHILTC